MSSPLLTATQLVKNFGGLNAISNVSVHFDQNELIGLIGPNGAGKTTLFNLLTGVTPVSAGTISLYTDHGVKTVNGQTPAQVAQAGVSRTFQNIRLFKELTVLDNVRIAMTNHYHEGFISSLLRTPKFYRTETAMTVAAEKLIAIFDLSAVADQPAKNLPYGVQRRLEIVRALATKPKLLFLDEPAAGMNPEETADLTRLIRQIQQDFHITVVLIEHDMSLVMTVVERLYVLEHGALLAEGTPREIQQNPAVIKAYLGGDA
ncbi:ABC transporter ATP-binding protein [Lactiplantibacillus mudanjiangensis]|uniref:Branched-chain amino acid transport ATP-binding protein LivG (TC 3.A.1.4.1) [Lactobacillus zymae] n=1 Tax=Lactiplantibacillus mudanjiangensis TaxID=1296538 RepID=A0A660EAP3_9LACO|nr:ABC transporter ATP-binding protein [Lactiplantibacillus mudanjiangensis]VDG20208.1 Branched-chain amino acid transport ATP-binding protein LivG (TC 3.A.1.4.1) [Lactobacillus zymae] [Lactiplantibacillus mudanjiangensis]VDG24100.1 Branched-chain amino acid transport ATP-binding protein LivG (TC 3.A.1.4.1) [Lactobacillus zymae] [Lactiplantibacillus mudanjiangensis]VDG30277.1 Branched-chain amino acid transport ATP-binding protein LivG (TC 3.A.1.4.1) [Lactobacillus zymae] [Lactiplantibacillus mu